MSETDRRTEGFGHMIPLRDTSWRGARLREACDESAQRPRELRDVKREQARVDARTLALAMVSHDLRAPLAAVRSLARLLIDAPFEPAHVVERASAVARCTERMASMLDDLIDEALLESGRLRLAPAAVDAASFVAELLERMRGALAVDRVVLCAPAGLPRLSADPSRLERVLVNLLSNALKYSSSTVVVQVAGRGTELELAVIDGGRGIAREALPHVFEPFFRERAPDAGEGLGLGLHIVRRIVEAHGGHVEVESEQGRGTTFRVTMPIARDSA